MPDMAWRSEKLGIRRLTDDDFLYFFNPSKIKFPISLYVQSRQSQISCQFISYQFSDNFLFLNK